MVWVAIYPTWDNQIARTFPEGEAQAREWERWYIEQKFDDPIKIIYMPDDAKPSIERAEVSQGDNDVRVSVWINPNVTERKHFYIGMSIGNFNSGVWYDAPLVGNTFDPSRQYPERFNIDMFKPDDSSATDVWITIKEGLHGEFLAEKKLSGVISPPQDAAPSPFLPIPEQSKFYALELTVPSFVGNFIVNNLDNIWNKLSLVASPFGWGVPLMEADAELVKVYLNENGSVTIGIVITAIIAALIAILAFTFGYVKLQWRLVEVARNQTVQEGLESKDSTLGILKGIRQEYIDKGLDTSEIDAAILRIAETEPEAPEPTLGGTNLGMVALVAVAVLALSKN